MMFIANEQTLRILDLYLLHSFDVDNKTVTRFDVILTLEACALMSITDVVALGVLPGGCDERNTCQSPPPLIYVAHFRNSFL